MDRVYVQSEAVEVSKVTVEFSTLEGQRRALAMTEPLVGSTQLHLQVHMLAVLC